MAGERKTGVYLCSCGDMLSETLSLDALAGELSEREDVSVVRTHTHFCSEEATGIINGDVERLGLDRVLIAGCSPFLKEKEFAGLSLNRYLVERVNIREQCGMARGNDPDLSRRKARTLVNMSLEKMKFAQPLDPLKTQATGGVLVIGGGVAGMNAAIDVAEAGREVILVEKTPFLGGRVAGFHRYFPRMCPPSCGLELMVSRIREKSGIRVLTSSEIRVLRGAPGAFEAEIATAPRHVDERECVLCGECLRACPTDALAYPSGVTCPSVPALRRALCVEGCRKCLDACPSGAISLEGEETTGIVRAGALILATGWDPYDPTPISEFGYGKLKNVVTNVEFEKILKEGVIPPNEPGRIAFIQCAGSRDERHLPYCSDVCCMVSIKQALSLKEENPARDVFIFYNDIRTPGDYEAFYRRARRQGIRFIKGIPGELKDDSGSIVFSVFDTIVGMRVDYAADWVVLATGMRPSAGTAAISETLQIPLNDGRHVESHLQCYPQETGRTGIFSAGCCKGPMDVARSVESAGNAAVKALQVLNRERVIEPGFPTINTLKCDVCKRCVEECPFRAFRFDEKGFPRPEISACRQCGVCMGSCPLGAVSLGGFTIDQLSAMIDALDTSFLGEDEPVILGFLCRNDAYRAADEAATKGLNLPPNFIGLMVPCAGAVNGGLVAKAISRGVDGILIAGCPEDQCHFIQGSALAKVRLADISGKLSDMYLEPERVQFVGIGRDEPEKLARTLACFVSRLREMGRNPLSV